MTRKEMEEELEQYYEAAGFANFRERVLDNKTDKDIKVMYEDLKKSYEEAEKDAEDRKFNRKEEIKNEAQLNEYLKSLGIVLVGGESVEDMLLDKPESYEETINHLLNKDSE